MKSLMETPILVIDVESIGLHGEPFAVAGAVFIGDVEKESFCIAIPRDIANGKIEDREWVNANVPHLECQTFTTLRALCTEFGYRLELLHRTYPNLIVAAECGYPVEANFLEWCGIDSVSPFNAPYPLHDIASFMLLAGMDPLVTYPRRPNEEPKHHPLCDVRQSARLMYEAINAVENAFTFYREN
jgi:hypothetical protein